MRWRTRLARAGVAGPLLVAALAYGAIALPSASPYALRVLTLAGVYAILALGYRFIFGLAGALSLAQGTFMGVGAYAAGILAVRWDVPFGLALPIAIFVPVLLALLVGSAVLRLQTHSFALATLLVGRIALLVAEQWTDVTGGSGGLGGVPPLAGRGTTLGIVWALVAAAAIPAWQLGRGRLGGRFALLRTSPDAARAVGIDTGALRLLAFVLSAAYAGLAGSLYVHVVGVLSPDVLGFPVSVTVLTIAVVGSRLRVAGAVAGAVLLTELPEWARFLREDSTLAFGCLLLLVVVLLPGGLLEAADRLLNRVWEAPTPPLPAPAQTSHHPTGEVLEVDGISCAFGGVRALRGVSLQLRPGEVLGVIGPNGSGKTTLLNVLSGLYRPDAGAVRLGSSVLTGRLPHQIARRGIARTFQTPVLVPGMTLLDNVALACSPPEAMALLLRLGVAADALSQADAVPPGVARRTEIARALATAPSVLLLDEPAAGLSEAEATDLRLRLRALADEGLAILAVEHSLPFLLPLADRLLCLDGGEAIAAGPPGAVRADPRVVQAYLG